VFARARVPPRPQLAVKEQKKEERRAAWKDKKVRWKEKRKQRKLDKIQAKADALEAEEARKEAILRGEMSDEGEDSDDAYESDESAGTIARKKEEAAMDKAAEGDFVVDICVVCAFGLPKVDYFGTVDSYIKPVWDGYTGEKEVLNGIKYDFKKNKGKGAIVPVKIVGKELAVRNSRMPRYDFHFQVSCPFSYYLCAATLLRALLFTPLCPFVSTPLPDRLSQVHGVRGRRAGARGVGLGPDR